MNYKKFSFFAVLVCLLMVSCSNKHKRLLNSNDHDAKYAAAIKEYNEKDYFHATQLFENLLLYYRGREKAESVNLYYAKSLMGSKDYYSAAYQFESFARWFPFSEDAQEAAFQAAYCKYLVSPDYELDQTLTNESMKNFQAFIDKYPNSPRIKDANEYMDKMREKLIKKDFRTSYDYFKREQYQSAQYSFRTFLNQYPDATYREKAMYYIVVAGYRYSQNSIENKKKERFAVVANDYKKFEAIYPNSDKLAELKKIYTECEKEIE